MEPIIVVLLLCLTASTGLVVFWRTYTLVPPLPAQVSNSGDRTDKLGTQLAGLQRTGESDIVNDLAIIRKPVEVFAYEQFLSAACATIAATIIGFTLLSSSAVIAALLVALFAALGWIAPKRRATRQAQEHKLRMNQALCIYQELAATAVAGGQSVQSALRNSASYGNGAAWIELRNAAAASMTSENTFASEIQKLADLYQLPELENLARLVAIADEGGTSKTTLQDLARQQSRKFAQSTLDDSENNTSKLILPTALIFLSFVLLLGFAVLDGLSQIQL